MEEEGDPANNNRDIEVAPALISVHSDRSSVVVAVGSDLRVFDLIGNCGVSLSDDTGGSIHKDSIRAIKFGAMGKLFVSAGDDKLVKIWSVDSWLCICNVSSEKRVSAVAISNDGLYVCFADKFGVVWVVDLDGCHGNQVAVNKKAYPLLAHYCSIITSLDFSLDGRFIISADRDFKIRVTVFPKNPLEGAHEIQSFCLGHTEFVTCLAFVPDIDSPQGSLISGSGDLTVRLWDITSGTLLDTCEVGAKADLLGSNEEEDRYSAITDLCAFSDGTVIAVAIQGLQGIVLLSLSDRTLSVAKVVSITGDVFIPTSLATCSSSGLLWMVSGVSNLHGSDHSSLTRVRAISGLRKNKTDPLEYEPLLLEDSKIPGGQQLLEKLQGSVSIKESVLSAAAEAVRAAMCKLLIKKQYSSEHRDIRKRTRNDRKIKQQGNNV